jgi:hypothetical protein
MAQLIFTETLQPGYSSITTATIQASNGDYVQAGRSYDEAIQSSGVAIRVQPNGSVVWERLYSAEYSAFFKSITQIADGSFIATGTYCHSYFRGDQYIWVVKLDAMGNKIWEGTFGRENQQNDGFAVAATLDGGFIVTGRIVDRMCIKPTTWVLKFDKNSNLQWENQYELGIAYAVTQTKDGGYVLSGAHNSNCSIFSSVYILRLNANGHIMWEKIYHEYEIHVLLESGIIETSDGNYALVAKSVIMKVDPSGNVIWTHQANNLDLSSIAQMPDGTYAIGGALMVDDCDHAYAAVLDQKGEEILWDNAEMEYPGGVAQILVTNDGIITGGGSGPVDTDESLMFLASFYPDKKIA